MRRSVDGLEEDLLAEEARRARQEDVELRAAPAGLQEGTRVLLQLLDPRLDLLLGEVRGLAELEEDVALGDADEPLGLLLDGAAARGLPERLGELQTEEVHLPQAVLDGLLVAGPRDRAAREELRRDLDRVLVAVGGDEEIVGVDRAEDLLAGREAHFRDVARRRALPRHLALRVDGGDQLGAALGGHRRVGGGLR